MEKAELILTFIADIIHYIAWPAAVITMFVLVRHPIKTLIDKITDIVFKKGDTEVRVNIAKLVKTITALAEQKPDDVIPLAEVTEKNYNWATFVATINSMQYYAILYMQYASFRAAEADSDLLRMSMKIIEETSSLTKEILSPDMLAAKQQALAEIRHRLAPILDNPS